jgi:hypothetical protein
VKNIFDIEHADIAYGEDILALVAETNRKGGVPFTIACANRIEASITATRNVVDAYAVAKQYMTDNHLPWPPPPGWTPGWENPESEELLSPEVDEPEPGSVEPHEEADPSDVYTTAQDYGSR